MKKLVYEAMEIEVKEIATEDVVTTSGSSGGGGGNSPDLYDDPGYWFYFDAD